MCIADGGPARAAAGEPRLLVFHRSALQFSLSIAGRSFTCTGRGIEPKDEFFQPVRFVESGRFFQRVVIDGLQFASADGTLFTATGNLEIALWPDRLSLSLGLNQTVALREGELTIAAGGRRASVPLAQLARAARRERPRCAVLLFNLPRNDRGPLRIEFGTPTRSLESPRSRQSMTQGSSVKLLCTPCQEWM